jgi:hypothetical protein
MAGCHLTQICHLCLSIFCLFSGKMHFLFIMFTAILFALNHREDKVHVHIHQMYLLEDESDFVSCCE